MDLSAVEPFVVRKGPDDTGDEFVRFEFTMYPAKDAASDGELSHDRWSVDEPLEHVHPYQEEWWEVQSGELQFEFAGERADRTVSAGEEVVVPKGVDHRHWNATGDPARVVFERRPALETDEWAESLFALAQQRDCGANGVPGPLQLAVVFDAYPETYLAALPVSVQKVAYATLAPVGRLLGLEATHRAEAFDVRQ